MGTVTVKINLDKTGYSAGIADTRKQAKQLADSLKAAGTEGASSIGAAQRGAELLGKSLQSAGAHGVSAMQASSAALRTLEGGMTNSIRAAERFISMIPGVGSALQTIFPVIGGIAFAGVIARIGEEAYKTVHELGQIRNVAGESFAKLTEDAQKNADGLRVTNDKLEQQIAALEHKPVNNLALALDEARMRADDLASSLDNDYQQFKKIIEETQKGVLSPLLNKGVDSQLGNQMNDQLANISTLARQQRDALKAGNKDAADDLGQKLRAAQDAALSFADNQTRTRNGMARMPGPIPLGMPSQVPYATAHGNQAMNLDAINAFKDLISGQEDTSDQQKRNTTDQASARALEASNKAQAELLKSMEGALEKQHAQYGRSVAEDLAYWSARISAFSKGGAEFHTVQMDQYRLQAELYQQMTEGKKKYLEAAKGTTEGNDLLGNAQKALTSYNTEALERQNRAAETYNGILAKGAEIAARNKAAFDEANVAIGLQQGTMSRLAAAQELARIHTQEHADALAAVNAELATQIRLIGNDPNPDLTADDRLRNQQNARDSAGNQISAINGAYAVTQQRDKANVYESTGSGAAADTYRTMLQSWSEMTANIAQAMTRAADSFNDDIAKAITGHGKKADFGKTFSNLGESLVKAILQKGESALFGGGQLGSSPQNAIWTRDAASAPGGAGGAAPNLGPFIRPFIGGQQGQQGQGSIWGNLLHSFLPTLFKGGQQGGVGTPGSTVGLQQAGNNFDLQSDPFQGFFASGGDVLANRPAIVGERGPEMFVPSTAGKIVPNSQFGGGGDTHNHFNVDARGATDPAAVHAAVMRAAPHIIAASIQSQHNAAKRSPRGR